MPKNVSLPPDLVVGKSFASVDQRPWHIGPEFDSIWKKATGKGVVVAVLDTGYVSAPRSSQADS